VFITEILAHTDPPQIDSVELHNPHPYPVSVTGWGLSDDPTLPDKYVVPAGTSAIEAHGYLVLAESQFNPTPGTGNSFALSSLGESIYLSAPDAQAGGWRLVHHVDFGPSENGVAYGLHSLSTGGLRLSALPSASLGQLNQPPQVGPIVINEIMHHPSLLGGTEYMELYNISGQSVAFHDALHPENTWRLQGATFDFPAGIMLGAGEYLLVADTDPAWFREEYLVPASVQIFGPMGRLNHAGETIALQKPDTPQLDPATGLTSVPYVTVDEVAYRSSPPWPPSSSGTGLSLGRIDPQSVGGDPINWAAMAPTPGMANGVDADQDGVPDALEASLGLNAADPNDAKLDSDADGAANVDEFLCGTDWSDRHDVLRLDIEQRGSGERSLRFDARPGRTYLLQVNDGPGSEEWTTIRTVTPFRAGSYEVVPPATNAMRLYRLSLIPPLIF
jgi:hypothetical protein